MKKMRFFTKNPMYLPFFPLKDSNMYELQCYLLSSILKLSFVFIKWRKRIKAIYDLKNVYSKNKT